jgi:hypothetical protein
MKDNFEEIHTLITKFPNNLVKGWKGVQKYKYAKKLALAILTLPTSTCPVERIFS